MKNTIRLSAAGIAMSAALGMSSVAHAQDTASADATAEILDALTLTLNNGSLDFGTMVVSGAGTVVLDPGNNRDCPSADVVCSGTTSVPEFLIVGTANNAVTINLPAGNIELRNVNFAASGDPEHNIELATFTSSANGGSGPEATLDGIGEALFTVGGTITFDGTEVPGVYEGTFDVSVEYS